MHRRQPFKIDLQPAAERRVECIAGAPEGVASVFGSGEEFEGGGAGRLKFVGDVGVPEFELGEGGGVGAAGFIVVDDWTRLP